MTTDNATPDNAILDQPISKILALATTAAGGEMETWSETKRSDFSKLFQQRSGDAQTILMLTANLVHDRANRSGFISAKHNRLIVKKAGTSRVEIHYNGSLYFNSGGRSAGGRQIEDLDKIASNRADEILRELPPIKAAVAILSPSAGKVADRIEVLEKRGLEITERLDEVTQPVAMSKVDQTMTIAKFRKMLVDLEDERQSLSVELRKLTAEGTELKAELAKVLYAGIPGLTDAVVDVIVQHVQRAEALDEMTRRVDERVRFGDSKTAMSLLSQFERDEVAIPAELKSKIALACQALGLSKKKKGTKALKEAK